MGGSAYTRSESSGASAADYKFDEGMPEEPSYDPGPDDVPPGYDIPDEPMDQSDNEAFFSDSNDDLPEGFL